MSAAWKRLHVIHGFAFPGCTSPKQIGKARGKMISRTFGNGGYTSDHEPYIQLDHSGFYVRFSGTFGRFARGDLLSSHTWDCSYRRVFSSPRLDAEDK